jgi:hypothetical protein
MLDKHRVAVVVVVVRTTYGRRAMRDIVHKLLLLCGAALVILRFVPSKSGEFMSKLFFDQAVHNRISDVAMRVVLSLGLKGDEYQTQIAGLTALVHTSALITEALGIALTCYIITRWI